MASQFKAIADAARAVVAALSGAPALVEVRKADALHPSEGNSACIITMGDEREVAAVSGAGSATDQGDVLKAYEVGFSLYRESQGDLTTDVDTHPDLVLRMKQALNRKSLAGVSTVYRTELVEHSEWERQHYRDGVEKSVFGIVFFNAETRLGNA